MKNKLILIGLSIMTAGSIVPSVGMFSRTVSTLAANTFIPFFKHNKQGRIIQISVKNSGTFIPLGELVKYENLNTIFEQNPALVQGFLLLEGREHKGCLTYAGQIAELARKFENGLKLSEEEQYTDSYTSLRTDIYKKFNKYENSNPNSKNWWKRVFAPLFVGAAVTTKTVIDSKDKTLGEKDTYLAAGTADVDSMNSFPEIVTPAANDIVDKAIANSVFLVDQKQPIAPSSVGSLSSNSRFGYFAHDGKIIATAAVAAFAGLSYATYKAYKNGYFSKFNPFGKTAVVVETPVAQEVKTEPAPVAQAPQKLAVAAQAVKNLNLAAKNKRRPALCPNCHEIH